jgi:hypothetical protein
LDGKSAINSIKAASMLSPKKSDIVYGREPKRTVSGDVEDSSVMIDTVVVIVKKIKTSRIAPVLESSTAAVEIHVCKNVLEHVPDQ